TGGTMTNNDVLYGQTTIPVGIRSRLVDNNNGITMHILEAGFEEPGRPLILLMHGYPELAFSWRKNLLPLAAAGYHVVAPDNRGYGGSGGADVTFDDSLWPFRPMERVRDTLGLVYALGYREVAMIVGQDFGASVSSWSTLIRPDVFRSMVLMTAPFEGAPSFPFNTANEPPKPAPSGPTVHDDLAAPPPPRHTPPEARAVRPARPRRPGGAAPTPQALPLVQRAARGERRVDGREAGCRRLPARLL